MDVAKVIIFTQLLSIDLDERSTPGLNLTNSVRRNRQRAFTGRRKQQLVVIAPTKSVVVGSSSWAPRQGAEAILSSYPWAEKPRQVTAVYRLQDPDNSVLHSICVVGFDQPAQHWIVLNSFGAGWSDGGFGRIAFGSGGLLSTRAGWQVVL